MEKIGRNRGKNMPCGTLMRSMLDTGCSPGIDLDPQIVHELYQLAQQFDINKLVLFGSRARGSCHKNSDIDLAVWGIMEPAVYLDFVDAVEEQVPTLLMFDIVDMNGINVSDALRDEITKDGVVLYEKV